MKKCYISGYRPEFQCADILPDRFNPVNESYPFITYDECSVTLSYNSTNSSETMTSCPNGYKYDAHDDISFVTQVKYIKINTYILL